MPRKVVTARHVAVQTDEETDYTCPVCSVVINFGSIDIVMVKCGHRYHKKCVQNLAKCKICNIEVGTIIPVYPGTPM